MATIDELRHLLARASWWAEPRTWILRDPDLQHARQAPFEYSAGVLGDLAPGGLYLLRGPRRVGKSVELKKTIERLIASGTDPRRILHVAADRLLASDLQRIVDAGELLTPRTGPRFWLFDEVTAITDGWPAAIKWLRDNDRRFGLDTVVLTGSSAANLGEAVKALAGRRGGAEHSDRILLPMSFRAFVRACSDNPPPPDPRPLPVGGLTPALFEEAVATLAPWLNELTRQWDIYLAVGGFPQAVAAHITGDHRARQTLRQTLLDVIHGEAFVQSRWSRAQSGAFVARLARGLASPTNRHDIATDLGTSANTVRRRIDALRDAMTVWPCHPCQPKGVLRPALRSQEKTYFTDPIYSLVPRTPKCLPTLAPFRNSSWALPCSDPSPGRIQLPIPTSTRFSSTERRHARRLISSGPGSGVLQSNPSTLASDDGGEIRARWPRRVGAGSWRREARWTWKTPNSSGFPPACWLG